jgi:hypothetical protein
MKSGMLAAEAIAEMLFAVPEGEEKPSGLSFTLPSLPFTSITSPCLPFLPSQVLRSPNTSKLSTLLGSLMN